MEGGPPSLGQGYKANEEGFAMTDARFKEVERLFLAYMERTGKQDGAVLNEACIIGEAEDKGLLADLAREVGCTEQELKEYAEEVVNKAFKEAEKDQYPEYDEDPEYKVEEFGWDWREKFEEQN